MDMLEKFLVVARDAAPFMSTTTNLHRKEKEAHSVQTRGNAQRLLMGSRACVWTGKKSCPLGRTSLMALCLVRTQIVPRIFRIQILRIQILRIQILVSIPTPALIPTKTDEHQMVARFSSHCMSFEANTRSRVPIL